MIVDLAVLRSVYIELEYTNKQRFYFEEMKPLQEKKSFWDS